MELTKRKGYLLLLLLAGTLVGLSACSYSFTGASVPGHLKTIAIPNFADRTGSGEYDLSQKLTTTLTQKFIQDNTLAVGDRVNSNCILEGTVVTIDDSPTVVSNTGGSQSTSETITARRITISVNATFKDLVKKQTIFEKNFSNYSDYILSKGDYTALRKKAIEDAIDKITEDILLGVVSNW
jgi:hypothetical protein